jgi:hypothetical protein
MKALLSLLTIIVLSVVALKATPHIQLTHSNESSRIESVEPAKTVNVPAKETKAVVAPVEQPKPVVQTPAVETPPPVNSGNCALAYNYDWPKQTAYAVCMAESSGDPSMIGDVDTEYYSCGLMQIRTLPGRPTCGQLQDGVFNMQYAYNMWRSQGFSPWSAYNNGKYQRYL